MSEPTDIPKALIAVAESCQTHAKAIKVLTLTVQSQGQRIVALLQHTQTLEERIALLESKAT
jgi:mannitol/fructose-specific phosphotransferase system IIA component